MLKLMLVDDEFIEREAMKSIINKNFSNIFKIKEASNGKQAIELAQSYKPHLIFMDIKMPNCSGIEAAKIIKEFLPHVHIVLITAFDYFDYAKQAISLKIDDFLLKPVEVQTVITITQKMIEQISNTISQLINNQKIEQTLEQVTKQLENEFISIINSKNISEKEIYKSAEFLEINSKKIVTATIYFKKYNQKDSISNIQHHFIKSRFIEKLRKQSKQDGIRCIVGKIGEFVDILFIPKQNDLAEKDIKNTIKNIIKNVKEYISIEIEYGICDVINNIHNLPQALFESKMSIFSEKEYYKEKYPYKLEKQIIKYISKKDFELVQSLLIEMIDTLDQIYSKEKFKYYARELYIILKRSIKSLNYSKDCLMPNADELFDIISNYDDMILFFTKLIHYSKETLSKNIDKNEILIKNLCEYLEENYNKNITLEEAASYIGFSTFYFSKIIKEYLNVSFVDYLASIRIRKAKEIIENTNLNISDVAYKVGYIDANYFTRVFKRIEGITPSQYKKEKSKN